MRVLEAVGILESIYHLAARVNSGPEYFVLNAMIGIWFAAADIARPFSTSKLAADWIVEHHLEKMPILGTPDWVVAPISAWLDRKVFFCERMTKGSYAFWDDRTVYPTDDSELYERAIRLMEQNGIKRCLFVKRDLKPFSYPRLKSRKLASFDNAMREQEKYAIYLVGR